MNCHVLGDGGSEGREVSWVRLESMDRYEVLCQFARVAAYIRPDVDECSAMYLFQPVHDGLLIVPASAEDLMLQNPDKVRNVQLRVLSLPVTSEGRRGSVRDPGLCLPGGSTRTCASGGGVVVGGRGPGFRTCSCGFFSEILRTRILQRFEFGLSFNGFGTGPPRPTS